MAIHSSILAGKNPMDKGDWRGGVHAVAKRGTTGLTEHACSVQLEHSFLNGELNSNKVSK